MKHHRRATRKTHQSRENGNGSILNEAVAYIAVSVLVPLVVISSAAFLI